jgi:hypothetical protein
MRSKDVIKFFDQIPVGTVVCIIPQRLPHMHRYEPPKEQPAPEMPPASEVAAIPSPAPAKPAAKASASPLEIARASPAVSAHISPVVLAHAATAPPLPAIGESPDHESAAAWRSMKGSILLANLPGAGSDKPGERHSKTSAAQ